MAGIKDIAEITGLSLATVSRVFNNSPLVSPKTKQKVLEAAKKLDYQPNIIAAALRSGKSRIIGVIVPEVNNHFFSNIINGIEQKANEHGYSIIIGQSHESAENEKKALLSFIQLKVDGILLSLSKETVDFSPFTKLRENKIPTVFFDRVPDMEQINLVVLDDKEGAFLATQHLIKRGCKHIVHIAGDLNVSIFKKRKDGFIEALQENGRTFLKDHILELTSDMNKDKLALKKLFINHPEIDGIFVFGDESCLHVMNILKTLNIDIPNKVKIIGFGNSEYSALTDPTMSTIDQKSNEMGLLAADIVLKSLDRTTTAYSKHVLIPKLIPRKSTK
ncbi:MAG: LacI family DNA-binding transcriptional regulator [Bacteroidota bacterium]